MGRARDGRSASYRRWFAIFLVASACGGGEQADQQLVPAGYAKVDLEGTERGAVGGDTVPVAENEEWAASATRVGLP